MTRIVLRVLAWSYLIAMVVSAACVIWSQSIRRNSSALCFTVFLIAFFAGPWTAVLHVWLSPSVKHKFGLTRKLCVGFDAYFAAYRYLLKGERFV